MGLPEKYLGWEVHHNAEDIIWLTQCHQNNVLPDKAGMTPCNPIFAPFTLDSKCQPHTDEDEVIMEYGLSYKEIIGHIRYLAD